VEQAIRLGFRGLDTACQPKHYHEPGVGAGREDLAIFDFELMKNECDAVTALL
jgi:hypothetical protein